MKRLRIAIVALGIGAVSSALTLSWLNFFYLPKKAKVAVVKELQAQTGARVELERLSFHPLKGLLLQNLKLRGSQEQIFFEASRASIHYLWTPLFLKREFIVSSITLEKPSLVLMRLPEGRWNLQGLLEKKTQTPQALEGVPKIAIRGGTVLLTDQTFPVPFAKRLTHVNAKCSLGLLAHLYVKGSFKVEQSPLAVTFTGSRSLKSEAWSLKVVATELSLSEFSPYAAFFFRFLESAKGDFFFDARSERINDYSLRATVTKGVFSFPFLKKPLTETKGAWVVQKGELLLENVKGIVGKTPVTLQGKVVHFQDPELDLTLEAQTTVEEFLEHLPQERLLHPLALSGPIGLSCRVRGKINAPSLSGRLEAKDLQVQNIPSLGTIDRLHGSIAFTEKALETISLAGQHGGFPFQLEGSLTDFRDPLLDVRAHFTQPLAQLEESALFQTISQKVTSSLEGLGVWDLTLQGPLRRLSRDHLQGTCRLQNAALKTSFLASPVKNLDGTFSFRASEIVGKGVTGFYAGDSFLLDGSLKEGETPKIDFSLATKRFQLSSRFTLQGKDLRPFTLTRRTSQSFLSVEGEIRNYENPVLELTGRWEGSIDQLREWNFLKGGGLATGALQGELALQFSLSGPKAKAQEMILSGDFSSELLSYNSWKFKKVSSRFTYRQETFTLLQCSGMLFGGRFAGDAALTFSDDKPYKFNMELAQARLGDALQMFPTQQKNVRGLLSGTFQAEGSLLDRGTLKGKGWLKIEEGDLFQIPILDGLTPVLRPLVATFYPELDERVAFREAYARFEVKGNTLHAENLILKGDRATLYGQGTVGFDRSIDFRLWVQFTDSSILERPTKLSRLKDIFVNEMGILSGEVRVSGTLAQPKYRYVPLPLNRLQELFRGTGTRILEGLFE